MQTIKELPKRKRYIPHKVDREAWRTALPHLAGTENFENFLEAYHFGVDIGVKSDLPPARAKRNKRLDLDSRTKFAEKIIKWHEKGHLLGPFTEDDDIVKNIREAPVFTVNKPDGGKRPVSDASRRLDDDGPSVNETIKADSPELATVQYLQIQQIIAIIMLLGDDVAVWAKDLQEGYYNLRVKESQIRLTAFIFEALIFIPMTLQMGLSSAPLLFTVFMWYVVEAMLTADHELTHKTVPKTEFDKLADFFPTGSFKVIDDNSVSINLIVYYLDDMFGIHHPRLIWKQYRLAQTVLHQLGLNAQEKKDRKPLTVQLILGLLFDCVRRCIRIPPEKGRKYIAFADKLMAQKSVSKRELFSLTGKTRHLALHIPVLAAFARGVEVHGFKRADGRQLGWSERINMCSTLKLSVKVLRAAIVRAMEMEVPFQRVMRPRSMWNSDYVMFTDAAGVHGGIGGFTAETAATYFQVHWNEVRLNQHHDILWKELVAVFVLLSLMKRKWTRKYVLMWCDNKPVVHMLITYKAKVTRPDLQWLIIRIAEICMEQDINPWYEWIEGTENVTADKLSRFAPQPFNGTQWIPTHQRNTEARDILNTAISATSKFSVNINDCVF